MQHTYRVVIEGIAPLIQCNPDEALTKIPKNQKRSASKQDPTEQWRIFVYRAEDGKTLRHPSIALESVLREAATSFKAKGRGSMKTAIKRTCFVEGDWLTITNKSEPDAVKDMRPRNSVGQIVQYYAPEFAPGWRMEFFLDLMDDEIVTPDHLKEILDFAGARIGIGVRRPKYGRFIVVSWDEVGEEKPSSYSAKSQQLSA